MCAMVFALQFLQVCKAIAPNFIEARLILFTDFECFFFGSLGITQVVYSNYAQNAKSLN
jgi:hypothetical protein